MSKDNDDKSKVSQVGSIKRIQQSPTGYTYCDGVRYDNPVDVTKRAKHLNQGDKS